MKMDMQGRKSALWNNSNANGIKWTIESRETDSNRMRKARNMKDIQVIYQNVNKIFFTICILIFAGTYEIRKAARLNHW